MRQLSNTSNLDAVLEDGDQVQTTVVELDELELRLATKGSISILSVRGPYGERTAREIEKLALRSPGSLGLEFQAGVKDPEVRGSLNFDRSVINLLKKLKSQRERRGAHFFLFKPPQKLIDFLALANVHEQFHIADGDGRPHGAPDDKKARAQRSGKDGDNPAVTGKRLAHLCTSLKRTATLEKGLDSAERCVKKLLPSAPPQFPGYDFAVAYSSSEKVGGDFFDFIHLTGGRLGIAIGDVSGHGIDAALIMGISKKLINIRAQEERFPKPSSVLKQVNSDITRDLDRRTFVTALYGVLDPATGEFVLARAGHEAPLLFGNGSTEIVNSRGIAIGLSAERFFESQITDVKITIKPGNCLLLCTDGLAECRNQKEAIFSRERLVFELDRTDTSLSAQAILDNLRGTLKAFAGDRPQEDDMTAILIQRLPEPSAAGARSGTTAAPRPSPGDV